MKKKKDKKEEIIKKYDSTSFFYDDRYSKIQREKYKYILTDFSLNGKVLMDAGCGTGLLYNYILDFTKIEDKTRYIYVGMDISWKMLLEFLSKKREKKNQLKHRLELVLSDMENLPFRNNIFHAHFSLTSLQNLPNIIDGIKESFRVSKDKSELKFSILKKNFNLNLLESILKSNAQDLEILDNEENLEDIVIKFILREKN